MQVEQELGSSNGRNGGSYFPRIPFIFTFIDIESINASVGRKKERKKERKHFEVPLKSQKENINLPSLLLIISIVKHDVNI